MKNNKLLEYRVINAENFLKENGAHEAIIGTAIDIRKLPGKILDCLLNAVEACINVREKSSGNVRRDYTVH